MTITNEQATWFAETFSTLASNVEKSVLGKRSTVELALTCMLTEGHLLRRYAEELDKARRDLSGEG